MSPLASLHVFADEQQVSKGGPFDLKVKDVLEAISCALIIMKKWGSHNKSNLLNSLDLKAQCGGMLILHTTFYTKLMKEFD